MLRLMMDILVVILVSQELDPARTFLLKQKMEEEKVFHHIKIVFVLSVLSHSFELKKMKSLCFPASNTMIQMTISKITRQFE